MFILLLTGCLSNVVGDWRATQYYGFNTSEDLIRLIIQEDLSGFLLLGAPGGLYSDVTVQEREDRERGFELNITTETLICEPIEKETSTREFSCLNINDQSYTFEEMPKI